VRQLYAKYKAQHQSSDQGNPGTALPQGQHQPPQQAEMVPQGQQLLQSQQHQAGGSVLGHTHTLGAPQGAAVASMPTLPTGTKRPAAATEYSVEREPKRTKTKAKRKLREGEEDGGGVGAPKLAYFEEEKETNNLMRDIERRRKDGLVRACPVQLLSEWRLANEIVRQMKSKSKSGGKQRGVSGSAASSRLTGIGLDQAVLDALQYAFKAHAQNVLMRAERAARHRAATAHRPPQFVGSEDLRRGLGVIKKREETAAELKAAEEREALLKAAGSK